MSVHKLNISELDQFFKSVELLSSAVFWIRTPDMKKQIYVSPSLKHIYGIESKLLYQYPDQWKAPIDPKQVIQVNSALKERCKALTSFNKPINQCFYYRLIMPNTVHFIKNHGFTIHNQDDDIIALAGISSLIPETLYEHLLNNPSTHNETNSSHIISQILPKLAKDISSNISANQIIQKKCFKLSKRELDCLQCMVEGMTAKETGTKLFISPRTVEDYINTLKIKLNCNNKLQLVSAAYKYKLIAP